MRLPLSVRERYSYNGALPILAAHSNDDPPIPVQEFSLTESKAGRLPAMRLPLARFTTRQITIVVALAGILCWTGRCRVYYQKRACYHRALSVAVLLRSSATAADVRGMLERSDFHRRMADLCSQRAWLPWLTVEPDPPELK